VSPLYVTGPCYVTFIRLPCCSCTVVIYITDLRFYLTIVPFSISTVRHCLPAVLLRYLQAELFWCHSADRRWVLLTDDWFVADGAYVALFYRRRSSFCRLRLLRACRTFCAGAVWLQHHAVGFLFGYICTVVSLVQRYAGALCIPLLPVVMQCRAAILILQWLLPGDAGTTIVFGAVALRRTLVERRYRYRYRCSGGRNFIDFFLRYDVVVSPVLVGMMMCWWPGGDTWCYDVTADLFYYLTVPIAVGRHSASVIVRSVDACYCCCLSVLGGVLNSWWWCRKFWCRSADICCYIVDDIHLLLFCWWLFALPVVVVDCCLFDDYLPLDGIVVHYILRSFCSLFVTFIGYLLLVLQIHLLRWLYVGGWRRCCPAVLFVTIYRFVATQVCHLYVTSTFHCCGGTTAVYVESRSLLPLRWSAAFIIGTDTCSTNVVLYLPCRLLLGLRWFVDVPLPLPLLLFIWYSFDAITALFLYWWWWSILDTLPTYVVTVVYCYARCAALDDCVRSIWWLFILCTAALFCCLFPVHSCRGAFWRLLYRLGTCVYIAVVWFCCALLRFDCRYVVLAISALLPIRFLIYTVTTIRCAVTLRVRCHAIVLVIWFVLFRDSSLPSRCWWLRCLASLCSRYHSLWNCTCRWLLRYVWCYHLEAWWWFRWTLGAITLLLFVVYSPLLVVDTHDYLRCHITVVIVLVGLVRSLHRCDWPCVMVPLFDWLYSPCVVLRFVPISVPRIYLIPLICHCLLPTFHFVVLFIYDLARRCCCWYLPLWPLPYITFIVILLFHCSISSHTDLRYLGIPIYCLPTVLLYDDCGTVHDGTVPLYPHRIPLL